MQTNTQSASTIVPASLQQYQIDGRVAEEVNKKKELGQDEFMSLMIAQIKHQDPFEPMDNGDFISQMAEFSTVTGIEKMSASLDELATTYTSGQTLEAISLVGREVMVADDTTKLEAAGSVEGRFELEAASGDVTLQVFDPAGTLVRNQPLGQLAAGRHDLSWDGMTDGGERASPGSYTLGVLANNGDTEYSIPVFTQRRIDSVEYGAGSTVQLNTTSGDRLALEDIRQIRQGTAAADTTTDSDTDGAS